jgi:nucleoside 2-deoxyribosyltransferase
MIQIFIITPYSSDNTFTAKIDILNHLSQKMKVEIITAGDYMTDNIFNLEKTLADLSTKDFFIADLSLERPSCYYEVGYIQALKKNVTLIAQAGTPIHQIIGEVAFYTDMIDYQNLMISIIKQLKMDV